MLGLGFMRNWWLEGPESRFSAVFILILINFSIDTAWARVSKFISYGTFFDLGFKVQLLDY